MSFYLNLPLFLIVFSLASSVLSSVLPYRVSRGLSLVLTLSSTLANVWILLSLNGENYTYIMGHFTHPWGNELRIGTMEATYSAFFSMIFFLVLAGGKNQIAEQISADRLRFYYVMADLVQAALLVLVYTNDIFTGYVFIEICTMSGCGLLMIRNNGRTILASVRYMIFSLLGSGLFLFGVIYLYHITGQLLMPDLKEAIRILWETGDYRLPLLTSICLITVGLGIKSGLFPFHFWMADTYGAAIPTSSAILSGLISKGYIFFLLKVIHDVFGTDVFYATGIQNAVYAFGAIGVVFGSVSALQEDSIFRMTAYSSAAQIGYIYMGIGLSPILGIRAAFFQILAHALTKSALFLSAGELSAAAGGKQKFHHLTGVAYRHPIAGLVFSVMACSMIGLPTTMGFISKYLFSTAALAMLPLKMIPTLFVLAISTVLNTLYFARTILRIWTGSLTTKTDSNEVLRHPRFTVCALCLVFFNLFLGISSVTVTELLSSALSVF